MKCRNSTEFLDEISSCCSILVKSQILYKFCTWLNLHFRLCRGHLATQKSLQSEFAAAFLQNHSASEVPCSTCVGMPCTNFTYWHPLVTSILSASRHVLKKSWLCSAVRGWCDHLRIEKRPTRTLSLLRYRLCCSPAFTQWHRRPTHDLGRQCHSMSKPLFQDGAWCEPSIFWSKR